MSGVIIANLEKKILGWKRRQQQLMNLYEKEGKLVTLWEAQEAEKRIEQIAKQIKKQRSPYGI